MNEIFDELINSLKELLKSLFILITIKVFFTQIVILDGRVLSQCDITLISFVRRHAEHIVHLLESETWLNLMHIYLAQWHCLLIVDLANVYLLLFFLVVTVDWVLLCLVDSL